MSVYIQLFFSFLKIGLFGFGGGYPILSLIQHEVEVHNWMTSAEFTDIVAISQITPGPIAINSATFVGYTSTHSFWGALIATVAVCLPSLVLMITLSRIFFIFKENRFVIYAFQGLRPTVVGLILAAALMLANTENFIDYKSFVIFISAFIFSARFKMHPALITVFAGICGLLFY